MKIHHYKYIALLIGLMLVFPLLSRTQNPVKREMRAVWVATVANIDWPSAPGLSTEVQKKEFVELLELAKEYHLNTIVFQIRPATDAFYPSDFEPWSQWLTGQQGKAPDPYYDPLQFAIEECRKRGLDIHVWLNPYRAVSDVTKNSTSPDHITNLHPEWFVTYGKTRYFDPGLPQTRNFVANVVADIVRRYEIDAIHMDDYFYPYRISGVDFPDSASFAAYSNGFSIDKRNDWRRNNVDLIIKQLHDTIKSIKPWVEFGISPFGVWRNAERDPIGSKTQAGQTNYDDLYADILKWQKEGWIDYVVPQLYWHIGMKLADYAVLADWWNSHTYGCPLYIGQAPYRIDANSKDAEWQTSDELIKQIKLNRNFDNISGSMFFSAKSMRKNPLGVKEKLLSQVYQTPALVPVNSRIKPIESATPKDVRVKAKKGKVTLSWENGENCKSVVVYKLPKKGTSDLDLNNPQFIVDITSESQIILDLNKTTRPRKFHYLVTSLSYTNHESEAVIATKKR
jgi:uncharacterized lipoprotein YddW (UPF0748 family)